MDHLRYFCLVFVMLSCEYVDALWSLAGKGLTSWLSILMSSCHFPIDILGQMWCLIVSIPDLCPLSYFYWEKHEKIFLSETIRPRALIFIM